MCPVSKTRYLVLALLTFSPASSESEMPIKCSDNAQGVRKNQHATFPKTRVAVTVDRSRYIHIPLLLMGFPFWPPESYFPKKEQMRKTDLSKLIVVENSLWVLPPSMERQS